MRWVEILLSICRPNLGIDCQRLKKVQDGLIKYRIYLYVYMYISGQIIATSHDLTPNGGLEREIP